MTRANQYSHLTNKLLTLLLIALLGIYTISTEAKSYSYAIDGGSPNRYPAIYDFFGCYFTDAKGGVLLRFVPGGSTGYWGSGVQAIRASERNPLPHGIYVRWFSIVENQFWEGSYSFNYKFLKNLTSYKIDNFLYRKSGYLIDSMSFVVNVAPGGLVTVWVAGNGEIFLLAQFQAQKMQEEPDWETFYYYSFSKMNKAEPREQFIKEAIQRYQTYIKKSLKGKAELFNDEQPQGKPLTAAPWLRLNRTYYWYLSLDNQYFTLRDYRVHYVNAEMRFVYAGDNQLAKDRPVPSSFYFYFQNKQNNNIPERIYIEFDRDEIMQRFQEMAIVPPQNEPINLYIDIKPDLSDLHAYVVKGDKKVQLQKIKPALTNLYNGGDNKNTPWPQQTKRWK